MWEHGKIWKGKESADVSLKKTSSCKLFTLSDSCLVLVVHSDCSQVSLRTGAVRGENNADWSGDTETI